MMVELKVLGAPEVTIAGRPVTAALDRKHVALLAYLAVEHAWVARDKVADLLWGQEYTDSKALQNLRQAVHEINHLLPGVIEKDGRQAIGLGRTTSLRLDIEQFEEARASGNFERAAALYRGAFLDGLSLKDGEAFEEWLRIRREYFERQALESLSTLMNLADAWRDNDALERNARRILSIDPDREGAYRGLMLALGRKGQYNEALRVYSDCAGMLRREFDHSPSAETMAVNERIHLARGLPRRDLPFHAATLVGREQELADATVLLLRPDCRLLTVLGPGGVGKTRLAIELARRNRSLFLHDVCYVALESRSGDISRENILSALAGALGVPISASRLLENIIDHLRQREILIVLDNFEAFVPEAVILNGIVGSAPDVKILVTSREMLNIAEETIYRVGGLVYPLDEALPPYLLPNMPGGEISDDRYDALALFDRVAGRLDTGFNTAANLEDVIRICRLVEGLPLALEMIAPWTLTMSCGEIADRISADMTNLIAYERNFPERHRSLNAVFEYSWNLLTPEERFVFRKLAVIVGDISSSAAEAIAGATAATLQLLARQSMLDRPDGDHYALHSLLRAFARQKLRESGEFETTQANHFAYFSRFVESRLPELRGMDQLLALRELAAEFGNIYAAWWYGIDKAPATQLLSMMDGIYELCVARSWYAVGIELATTSKEVLTRRSMTGLMGRLLLHEGLIHHHLGNYHQATLCADEGRVLCEREADPKGVAQALFLSSTIHYDSNRYEEAERLITESLNLNRSINNWEGVADWYLFMGHITDLRTIFSPQGKQPYKPPHPFMYEHYWPTIEQRKGAEEAIVLFKEAQRLYSEIGHLYKAAWSKGAPGHPYYRLHLYDAAADCYREAAELFRQLNSVSNRAHCLNWLAWVLHWQGEMDEARHTFHQALRLGLSVPAVKRVLDCLQKYSLFLWRTERSHFMPLVANTFVAQHPNTDGRIRVVTEEWVQNISDFMRQDEGQEAVDKALAFGRSQTLPSLIYYLVPDL